MVRDEGDSADGRADVRDADREAAAALVLKLRQQGISSQHVLSALERVPRRMFLAAPLQRLSQEDAALPIECGQTISQPSLVAMMTEALDIQPTHRVLEVGTGSGYQAAILGLLAGEVHSLERYRTLGDLARARLRALRITTVTVHHVDGMEGLPEQAPFDRIIVTAADEIIPPALLAQLAEGGKLIMPRGPQGAVQELVLVVSHDGRFSEKALGAVRFVPLVEGAAGHL